MLKLLLLPLMLLLGNPPGPATPDNPGEEHLVYELRYKNGALKPKVAKAYFNLIPDTWEGKDVYTAQISIDVKAIFRLFMKADYQVTGHFTRPGMEPLYYYCPSKEGWGECHYTPGEQGVHFSRMMGEMEVPEEYFYFNDGKTMELMSVIYTIRWRELKLGEPIDMNMLLAGKIVHSTIVLEENDTEKYPGHTAQRLKVEMVERGLMENGSGNVFYIWREAEGTRPILGLQVPLSKKGSLLVNIIESENEK